MSVTDRLVWLTERPMCDQTQHSRQENCFEERQVVQIEANHAGEQQQSQHTTPWLAVWCQLHTYTAKCMGWERAAAMRDSLQMPP